MYEISVSCHGLLEQDRKSVTGDILEEFGHRDWHHNPRSEYKKSVLTLTVENDFDESGQATLDEFIDAVHACVNYSGEIKFCLNYVKLV